MPDSGHDRAAPDSGTGFRHVGDHEVHRGKVLTLVDAGFEAPDGSSFRRDVVRSPGAVGAIPVLFDAEGVPSVVLVRQYRASFDDMILEIPAGMRDVLGEPLDVTAARELVEEVGLRATDLRPLVTYYPSPGMTDSVLHIFVATDVEPVDRSTQGPEEDHSEVVHLPLTQAVSMIGTEILDSKTIIALLMVERQLLAADRPT